MNARYPPNPVGFTFPVTISFYLTFIKIFYFSLIKILCTGVVVYACVRAVENTLPGPARTGSVQSARKTSKSRFYAI